MYALNCKFKKLAYLNNCTLHAPKECVPPSTFPLSGGCGVAIYATETVHKIFVQLKFNWL